MDTIGAKHTSSSMQKSKKQWVRAKHFTCDCYIIMNDNYNGLHWIQGVPFWRTPKSMEAMENFTKFSTQAEATSFMTKHGIEGFVAKLGYAVTVNPRVQ